MLTLKRLLSVSATAAVLAVVAAIGSAAAYPTKTITLIVPFPPGGSTDIVGRIVAEGLSKELGQSVVVDNRGGAGGTVGTAAAAKTAPDGYTLSVASTSTHAVGPAVHARIEYDPIKGFVPIGIMAETPYVLTVNPKLEAASVSELVTLAKSKPGQFNYGSAGIGSTTHLAAAMFVSMAGLDMVHVPYKGNAPATTALMGGEIQMLVGSMPAVLSQIKAGTIRPLAVGSARRSPELPDVPTMKEAGLADYEASLWLGIVAPAGTPDAVVRQLNEALVKVVQNPDVAERLRSNGAEPLTGTPEEFAKKISDDLEKYSKIVTETGARVN